jgi:hypothetical protein
VSETVHLQQAAERDAAKLLAPLAERFERESIVADTEAVIALLVEAYLIGVRRAGVEVVAQLVERGLDVRLDLDLVGPDGQPLGHGR